MTRGRIEMQLLTSDAPVTTWNFAQLAKSHYFDNSTFMRVVPNFVIQGGDPRNDMNGGPGYAIRDEINLQKYTRAAAGMALSGPDTGGSQFFITHSPQPHLDGGYTIFGRVTARMAGVVGQTERGGRGGGGGVRWTSFFIGRFSQLIGMIILPIGLLIGLLQDNVALEVRLL